MRASISSSASARARRAARAAAAAMCLAAAAPLLSFCRTPEQPGPTNPANARSTSAETAEAILDASIVIDGSTSSDAAPPLPSAAARLAARPRAP